MQLIQQTKDLACHTRALPPCSQIREIHYYQIQVKHTLLDCSAAGDYSLSGCLLLLQQRAGAEPHHTADSS